ncbi:tRNA lysidine(34) synthetase TilS [Salicibibacter cibarius]|uniref:tRNA(Ile)-lysidine synthase n=1 Tax=Salicibibacter cibarius TaxID=2743000 RepID=A0A7T7C9X3_9BACI|nr:tRNA lysidine(34) synthetase TilS [Salicibibacter cibarius]QQK74294.1 tRNA lysidine(34) synthetase TilS [Salicibibacter cibarius]
MKRKIDAFAARFGMFSRVSSVLVAVSGGVDSMALLHYLLSQRDEYGITVMAAHCNHGLRKEAEEDERLVESFCAEHHIPFFTKYLDLPKDGGKSIHPISRKMRYDFFSAIMKREKLDILATAHHGDDQIETILMQQMRGFDYYRGQMGIPVERPFSGGRLIRPFLPVTKKEIITYAQTHAVPWREDESNLKDDYTRNRVRKQLLPTLKQENREAHTHFQKLAEDFRVDAAYLTQQAEKVLSETAVQTEDGYVLKLHRFREAPIALQRRVIHLLLTYLYNQKHGQFSRIHIEECFELISDTHPSAQRSLPNHIKVYRNYEQLHFTDAERIFYDAQRPLQAVSDLPAKVETGLGTLIFEPFKGTIPPHDDTSFYCPISKLNLPLSVRARNPGDVIRPLGLGGTQKLKQIMIDEKVPRPEREWWPIITDATGAVLWAPLLKKSEGAGRAGEEDDYVWMQLVKKEHAHT